TTSVKATRSRTATPAPRIMPHSRCRGGRERQAIAITTALSPDRMMLTPMICSAAIQNGACVMSCHMKSTGYPLPALAPAVCRRCSPARIAMCGALRRAADLSLADDLVAGEELGDLDGRGLGRIGAVHRVLADGLGVDLADGAGRSLGRIGRSHHVAVF